MRSSPLFSGVAALASPPAPADFTPAADSTASSDNATVPPARSFSTSTLPPADRPRRTRILLRSALPGRRCPFQSRRSQDLVTQLGGADVDVLATANESTMRKAADAFPRSTTVTLFAPNSLNSHYDAR